MHLDSRNRAVVWPYQCCTDDLTLEWSCHYVKGLETRFEVGMIRCQHNVASLAKHFDRQQLTVHVSQQVVQSIILQTWQHSKQEDDDGIEKQDVGNADPNGQPAPPVVNRQVNGAHDAITQSLSCRSIWIQLILPVTCRQAITSLSSQFDFCGVVAVTVTVHVNMRQFNMGAN